MPKGGKRPGAGRPAGKPNRDTAQRRAALADLCAGHVETALATLAEIAAGGESEAARVSAAVAILDRAYGKPGQAVDLDVNTPETPERIERIIITAADPLTDEARAELDVAWDDSGKLDLSQLSTATLEQLVEAADMA